MSEEKNTITGLLKEDSVRLKGRVAESSDNNLRGILNTTSSLRGRLNVLTLEFGDGRDIELSVIENYLVWRRVGDAEWKQLFSLDTITPQRGTDYWTEEDQSAIIDELSKNIGEIASQNISHKSILDTDKPDLHPIKSIEGLQEALDSKSVIEAPESATPGSLLLYGGGNKATVGEYKPTDFATKDDLSRVKEDQTYVHVQSFASSEWSVSHGLGKMPSVTVVDSAGSIVIGEINYIDQNSLSLKFTGAFSGKAYIN